MQYPNTPQSSNVTIITKILSKVVTGTISPYPTVTVVITLQ